MWLTCVSPQVSEMVRKLHRAAPPTFGADLIQELVESFGRCPRWSGRQAFVFVCQVRAPFTPALSLRAELCYLGSLSPELPVAAIGAWSSRVCEGKHVARPLLCISRGLTVSRRVPECPGY